MDGNGPLVLITWMTWFALIPIGGTLIFGGAISLWLRQVLPAHRWAWLVTVALSLLFFIFTLVLIEKFVYPMPG